MIKISKTYLLVPTLLVSMIGYSQEIVDGLNSKDTSPTLDNMTFENHPFSSDFQFITTGPSLNLKSDYNKESALVAIKKNKKHVLFSGGFGGMPDFDNKRDIDFQKRYGVTFYSQDCIRFGEDENEDEYNLTIFNHLDQKFGKKWRPELRSDAIAFVAPSVDDSVTSVASNIEKANQIWPHGEVTKRSESFLLSYIIISVCSILVLGVIVFLLIRKKRK